MIRPVPQWGRRGWTVHRGSSWTITGSAVVGAAVPLPSVAALPSPVPGAWWGRSLRRSGGSQGRRGGRGRLELLRGGRQVAPSSRGGVPTVYNTSCFSLSLSLFSLSLFPVSPALPFPPPFSYLCLRPASGPRGLCFTPLVAHRAEEAADPWYNTAWLGWLGYTSPGGSRNGLAWLLKAPSSPKIQRHMMWKDLD